MEHMPLRTRVCRKSDMRRPKGDKRSALPVKYGCHGSVRWETRSSKCDSGIQHKRLGDRRPKTLYLPFQTLRLHKVLESIFSEVLLPTHQQAHMPSQP